MDSLEYWRQREEAHAAADARTEMEINREILTRFRLMLEEVQKQIDEFYRKYARSEEISMAEAKERVSKFDVESFQAKAAEYVKNRDFSEEANEQLKLYNLTMKLNRLEMLKSQMGMAMVAEYNEIEKLMEDKLYLKAMDEYSRQAGILGATVQSPQELARDMRTVVNEPFKNATWHNRLWAGQSALADIVSTLVTNGIIQGEGPRELARRLVKAFGVGGDTGKGARGAAYDAVRLMRTELARVQTDVQMYSFKANGFDEYVFLAVGDARTCEICGALDGKHFALSKEDIGLNAPPMHPNCRCSTAAWVDRPAVEAELFGEQSDFGINSGFTDNLKHDNITLLNIPRSLGAAGKNYPIKLPGSNGHTKFVEGQVLEGVPFAGKDCKKQIRDRYRLESFYGYPADEWQKISAIAYVTIDGKPVKAEIHWYEAQGERVEFKIKRLFENG